MIFVVTATLVSLASILLTFFRTIDTYKYAPLFLIPIVWAPYFLRNKLRLHPVHYALFAIGILLHNLGALGMYQRSVLGGVPWDAVVHFVLPLAAGLIVRRMLALNVPGLRPWASLVLTVLIIMGIGALHEIMEYASYLMLGEGKGMLKPSTSYTFDTQRDLLANLAGVVVAVITSAVTEKKKV